MATKEEDEIIDVILEGEEDIPERTPTEDPPEGNDQEDDHLSDQPDSELDNATDEDREAIRERRRQERADRKQRAREREESLRRDLSQRDTRINELQQRLDTIDRRSSTSEIAQLGEAKRKSVEAYNYYKDQIRLGTESQNGAAVAEATEKLFEIRSKISQLDNIEKSLARQSQQPQPLDPQTASNAKAWAGKNKWYDVRGTDQDSRVVLMLDQTLAEEGWNPKSTEYWEELDNRVKKYLPHRAIRDNITTGNKPRNVVSGSGRETSSNSGGAFRLSAERVKALKDAGKWEDPVERNKMIKQYRQYDRDNANGS